MFLQGTKMEAIASGYQTWRFNRLLALGEVYEIMGVGFAPTFADSLRHIFCICSDYYVVLSQQTMVNAPMEEILIPECPCYFMEFEVVYVQDKYYFAGISRLLNI